MTAIPAAVTDRDEPLVIHTAAAFLDGLASVVAAHATAAAKVA